jgi:hypothetical protein
MTLLATGGRKLHEMMNRSLRHKGNLLNVCFSYSCRPILFVKEQWLVCIACFNIKRGYIVLHSVLLIAYGPHSKQSFLSPRQN